MHLTVPFKLNIYKTPPPPYFFQLGKSIKPVKNNQELHKLGSDFGIGFELCPASHPRLDLRVERVGFDCCSKLF